MNKQMKMTEIASACHDVMQTPALKFLFSFLLAAPSHLGGKYFFMGLEMDVGPQKKKRAKVNSEEGSDSSRKEVLQESPR